MHNQNWIAVLDFGSQYTQLIARRIREQNVYCEILRFDTPAAALRERTPKGIILSGGPASVFDPHAPSCDPALFELPQPILGICYGMQTMARVLGGHVTPTQQREYGGATIRINQPGNLLRNLPESIEVWMSHGDLVASLPPGFHPVATTPTCPVAAMADLHEQRIGIQFHPEVVHTQYGIEILRRFIFDICSCSPDWKMTDYAREAIAAIREQTGNEHVLCGLSGGVDSSVVAALLHQAIGPRLHCVFVDTGLLRHAEADQVKTTFADAFGIDLRIVPAAQLFLDELKGIEDPEEKRKKIGRLFIDVFAREARSFGHVRYLAQGTLYPDVIESISPLGGPSVTIKSHHNVGGLPPELPFELIEPLRELFKDEVRILGRELGLPDALVMRQPFPGPGLAVRILGEVTAERIDLLRQADRCVREVLEQQEGLDDIWQAFAVLLPVRSVGVMGDSRTYEHVIAVRAVQSLDGMTADWYRLPHDTLDLIANRIVNDVRGVNRVVYDITSKPPGTIEWE